LTGKKAIEISSELCHHDKQREAHKAKVSKEAKSKPKSALFVSGSGSGVLLFNSKDLIVQLA